MALRRCSASRVACAGCVVSLYSHSENGGSEASVLAQPYARYARYARHAGPPASRWLPAPYRAGRKVSRIGNNSGGWSPFRLVWAVSSRNRPAGPAARTRAGSAVTRPPLRGHWPRGCQVAAGDRLYPAPLEVPGFRPGTPKLPFEDARLTRRVRRGVRSLRCAAGDSGPGTSQAFFIGFRAVGEADRAGMAGEAS
jgi:hypothetical protein